jgi:hypothetical protein
MQTPHLILDYAAKSLCDGDMSFNVINRYLNGIPI